MRWPSLEIFLSRRYKRNVSIIVIITKNFSFGLYLFVLFFGGINSGQKQDGSLCRQNMEKLSVFILESVAE